MVFAGSTCIGLNNFKEIEETIGGTMGKDVIFKMVEDVEEGEISDSTSVEEISEEDFVKQEKQQEAKVPLPKDSNSNVGDSARVWTMRDIYNYPGFRGYGSGLVNLAWAQAVQNKPLKELFLMDDDAEEKLKRSSSSLSVGNAKEVDKVVIVDSGDEMEVEKEEGELEEGEIDLDSEPAANKTPAANEAVLDCESMTIDNSEIDLKTKELEKRLNSIREALKSVTLNEAEKSFGDVCLQLLNKLESLRQVLLETSVSRKEPLVQLSFAAVKAISYVFCSMSPNQREGNKDIISRLVSSVKNDPPLLAPEQIKEIEGMTSSVDSFDSFVQTKAGIKEKEIRVSSGINSKDSDASPINATHVLNSSANFASDSAISLIDINNPIMLSEVPRQGVSNFKGRGVLLPLLDLHKDHDADSLPSPTREAPSCFPVQKRLVAADRMLKSVPEVRVALNAEGPRLHPYETDAVKAVSTYQQKFNRSSFFMSERLPSPTPSEDDDNGGDDTVGEVSSSSAANNLRSSSVGQPMVSASTPVGSSSMQGQFMAKSGVPVISGSNITIKPSVRPKDPRLRHAKSDMDASYLNQQAMTVVDSAPKVDSVITSSSRKQKPLDEYKFDGPALKRQRNALENTGIVRDAKTAAGSGGWLDDSAGLEPHLVIKNQTTENVEIDPRNVIKVVSNPSTVNGPISANEHAPLMDASMTSLPAILKDIAVNPTMLLNILKMGQQQRLAAEAQQKSADPAKIMTNPSSSSSMLGSTSLVNVPSMTSGMLQAPAGIPPISLQKAPMDDPGKIRMKLRDPRRALHGNALQKSGSLVNEQFRNIVRPLSSSQGTKDNLCDQKQDGQADNKLPTLQSVEAPDIARQFTQSLKNIANIMSVSNGSTSPSVDSQSVSSQPVPSKVERIDLKAEEQCTASISSSEAAAAGTSRSPAIWGEVEHLFDGYDDQQKAAIQRERARRIEEQKKMFAARKLCLVLDLDHTLLNSAKFNEVDPVHDEILRKKEEQDHEKPQRHLFRFHHMGMWTKLRPGVWHFLEKASQLFELHLYTMGNKLYATEMAKVLDPTGVLFSGRVISRGDDGDDDEAVPKSKDLEGVLGMESAVVIIDDSVRVWPHNKLNLIVVERYTYFPCSRRQFGLLGPSLLEIDHDERQEDGTLASSLAVIERIHQIFFSHPSLDDADVRNILALEQRKILGGCRIVFSRVFPVGEVKPHLHPLWQTAEQFGAVCTNLMDNQVTHVVANSLGTDKVNWALSSGKYVVHPGWVEASALLYRRANEQDFAIKP